LTRYGTRFTVFSMARGTVAPEDVRKYVAGVAAKTMNGTEDASAKLELSRETIARIIAGLPVQKGTIAQVEKKMAEDGRGARRVGT